MMIDRERIHYSHGGESHGDRVVYWMQRSCRSAENHALEYAILEANRRSLPLVVVVCLDPMYPSATGRSFRFMLEGLAETEVGLRERGILLLLVVGDPTSEIPRLTEDAALLVVDRGYLRHERVWRKAVSKQLECSMIEVESDVVVPVRSASVKEEWSAATLRRKITPQIERFLHPVDEVGVKISSLDMERSDLFLSDIDDILNRIGHFIPEENAVARGGRREAWHKLNAFLATPAHLYDTKRNDPGWEVTSGLSPYLHFGQISPIEVARSAAGRSGFLEELIVRRELAINFVWYNDHYDQISCLPAWAFTTLAEHSDDRREYSYTLENLRRADTHDPFWNAAQKEVMITGRMHNYMRMYWGKKILEWSETPGMAYRHAVSLNDEYELDGRDPNGYAGVAWCFGKHDRAWKERPIFGKVRYMNANGLRRKGDILGYLDRIEDLDPQ